LAIHYFFCVTITAAAYSQEASTNDWHPNAKKLDFMAAHPDPFMGDARNRIGETGKQTELFFCGAMRLYYAKSHVPSAQIQN
jgi:hypothetical protein